jgi:hypothetical protein
LGHPPKEVFASPQKEWRALRALINARHCASMDCPIKSGNDKDESMFSFLAVGAIINRPNLGIASLQPTLQLRSRCSIAMRRTLNRHTPGG